MMNIKNTQNLDDLVSAAGAAIASSTPKGTSAASDARKGQKNSDVDVLIKAAAAKRIDAKASQLPDNSGTGLNTKVSPGETALPAEGAGSGALDTLVHQATRDFVKRISVETDVDGPTGKPPSSNPRDIHQLIAHAAGAPAPTGAVQKSPATGLEAQVTESLMSSPKKSVEPPRQRLQLTVQPWMSWILLGLVLLTGGWLGYQQRVVNVPLIKSNPAFSLTAKQTELVEHLRAAHAEVERYRLAHGQLPNRIELKIPRVHFYLRPMKHGYMVMAVSENQNLVLMNDGRWYKAR